MEKLKKTKAKLRTNQEKHGKTKEKLRQTKEKQ